ncbi:uncharacterized protein LOC142687180 isoform X2 [Rhinoderma darwinii]|uniref:uncharacterized protein LOC142687180 isoform X2 n=1 Tax=Rhinoderma darwinii TaxID=43563 RepID=UPI003F666B7C
MEDRGQEPLMFDDVAVYFTQEEWGSLEEWQKELYKEVMMDNYHTLRSLGIPMVKSELLFLTEGGAEGHLRWEELGLEPTTPPDRQSRRDAEELTEYHRERKDRRLLTYGRRIVRKRCSRRSPNFSRVELECFVSLMDRYLPDELQRTGAVPLRQRRSILMEIARCLEPMSGCLRTPRQLLHRWADFNNRDFERLMEIRMRLHFAASRDQSCDSSDEQNRAASSLGRRWRRSISRPLSSSSSSSYYSSSEEGEETQGDPLSLVWDEGLQESCSHHFPVLPDRPPQTLLTPHIDAQGRYIVPPLLPKSGKRWWQRCAGEWNERQGGLQGSPQSTERSSGKATSATLYSPLHKQGPLTIKSEPSSEEEDGGGSWGSDIPSPESAVSSRSHRRNVSEGPSTEHPSPALVSHEDTYHLREPPAGGHTGVKLEYDLLSEPSKLDPQTCTEQKEPPESRSIKRSPNFSPAELECFVALMDHFLPDNLIRAGAIPIRKRKAILLEIARRLEPLSGCLRTPRQLRHRWTDFNNRDSDRLEEIRSRLRRAARQECYKKPSKAAESAPTAVYLAVPRQ